MLHKGWNDGNCLSEEKGDELVGSGLTLSSNDDELVDTWGSDGTFGSQETVGGIGFCASEAVGHQAFHDCRWHGPGLKLAQSYLCGEAVCGACFHFSAPTLSNSLITRSSIKPNPLLPIVKTMTTMLLLLLAYLR